MLEKIPRCIPDVSAEGAALFRIVFGTAVVLVFATEPMGPDYLTPWLWISGALFVAGFLTPISFAAFTAGAVAWGFAYSRQAGHHPISAILVALLCLLPSRWGDAWSIDAWLRTRLPRRSLWRRRAEAREYGYTIWVPGVVLGLTLAAAAFSKLYISGLGWIVNGTVKYHFVTDAPNAPVDWGVRYGVIPAVAVALSLGAVAVESVVLPAAVIGPWIVRLLAGLAVIPMLLGFWLFQGVFWPGWWILLLSFAPWHLIGPAEAGLYGQEAKAGHYGRPRSAYGMRWAHVQVAVLVAAVVHQVAASAMRIEWPPVVSAYDMYSKSYDSPAEYPADGGESYWLIAEMADQRVIACRIDDDDGRRLGALPEGDFATEVTRIVGSCVNDKASIRALAIEERRPNVDWVAGRYLGLARVLLVGPVPFAADSGA